MSGPGTPEHLVDPLDPLGDPDGRIAKRVTSFTRRGSRLPQHLTAAMERYGRDYLLDPPRAAGSTTVLPQWRIDLESVFGRRAPVTVEVGSGHGDQCVASAATYPERDFLAVEVWLPGVARTVEYAQSEGLTNVRILVADAALALATALPEASVAELWTYFPDPWRKARHHKRRLIQPSFADTAARLLADQGQWLLATDWQDYAEHMREVLRTAPQFRPAPGHSWDQGEQWSPRALSRITTHFEKRGQRAGREVRDLAAVRIPRREPPRG